MRQFRDGIALSAVCLALLSATPAFAVPVSPALKWSELDGSEGVEQEKIVVNTKIKSFGSGVTGFSQFNLMMASTKPIKNAPYTAEVISEFQQKLADGNVISNKTISYSARDAVGRVREEYVDTKGETKQIFISDPESGRLIINPRAKTVMKFGELPKKAEGGVVAMKAKSKDGEEVIELHLTSGEGKSVGKHMIIHQSGAQNDLGKTGDMKKHVTVDVRGNEAMFSSETLNGSALDPAIKHLFTDERWASKRQTKSIGSRFIEGIKVDGKLVSYEIPAGAIGNAQAINVTDETWVSPELEITLYSKHSDPRSGDRIYRLNNVKRVDSDAAVFAAPADYKIIDLFQSVKSKVKMDVK